MGSKPWLACACERSRRPRALAEKASADLKKLQQILTMVQLSSNLRDSWSRMTNFLFGAMGSTSFLGFSYSNLLIAFLNLVFFRNLYHIFLAASVGTLYLGLFYFIVIFLYHTLG